MRACPFILASTLTLTMVYGGSPTFKKTPPVHVPFWKHIISGVTFSPSIEVMTNSMGHSIPVVTVNLNGAWTW